MALFRGRLDESAEWTRSELDVNPGNAMAWYQLGDVYVREAKWNQAITMLQRSLWINPFYSGPYILLGRAYMKTGPDRDGRGDAAARHPVRSEQSRRALPAGAAPAAARTARGGEDRSLRSRRSCRGSRAMSAKHRTHPSAIAAARLLRSMPSLLSASPAVDERWQPVRELRSRISPGRWASRIGRSTAASIGNGSSSRPTVPAWRSSTTTATAGSMRSC